MPRDGEGASRNSTEAPLPSAFGARDCRRVGVCSRVLLLIVGKADTEGFVRSSVPVNPLWFDTADCCNVEFLFLRGPGATTAVRDYNCVQHRVRSVGTSASLPIVCRG